MPGPRGVLSSGANRAVNRPRRVPANGPPKSWFQLEAHAELNGRDLAPPPPRTRGSSEVKCALLWAQVFGAIASDGLLSIVMVAERGPCRIVLQATQWPP